MSPHILKPMGGRHSSRIPVSATAFAGIEVEVSVSCQRSWLEPRWHAPAMLLRVPRESDLSHQAM